MLERNGVMRLWAWIVGAMVLTAVGVAGILFVGHRMFQTEQHLETVQSDLERSKDKVAQAIVEIGEREKEAAQLKSELDTSKSQRNELQIKLDEATTEVEQLKTQFATTQSELRDKQAGLEAAQTDLESAKQATDKAEAEAVEIEKSASNAKSELEKSNAERSELQTRLDKANSEIERLKREQARAAQRGDAVILNPLEPSTDQAEMVKAIAGIDTARAAVTEALSKAPLGFRRILFVSAEPESFADYTPRPNGKFSPGEPLIIYSEPIGVTWTKDGDQFSSKLVVDFEIRSPDGQLLAGQKGFGEFALSAREPPLDFMTHIKLDVTRAHPGSYILSLTMHDTNSGKSVSTDLPFEIK